MVTPSEASNLLGKHFEETSPEEFGERLKRYCPDLLGDDSMKEAEQQSDNEGGQLILFQPQSTQLPLDAYLACALTGLNADQRQLMFHLSDTVASVCEGLGITLYEPRKNTDPVHHSSVEDAEVFRVDRA